MNQERLLKIILSPLISEKAIIASEFNVHVFRVLPEATKSQIKDAIEYLFNAKVEKVRVLNVKPKLKIFRGKEGTRKGWKKAYVTLQSDQKLDLQRSV